MKIWFCWASGKLWYLQHNCVWDTIVYHLPSDFQVLANNFSSSMVHFSQGCNIYSWYVTIQPYYWGGRLWNMAITWVTTLKIQIVAFCKELHRRHTFGSCLKMCKYELDPASIVEVTEWTRFCTQTDGQTDGRTTWNQYSPFQLHWSGDYNDVDPELTSLAPQRCSCDLKSLISNSYQG